MSFFFPPALFLSLKEIKHETKRCKTVKNIKRRVAGIAHKGLQIPPPSESLQQRIYLRVYLKENMMVGCFHVLSLSLSLSFHLTEPPHFHRKLKPCSQLQFIFQKLIGQLCPELLESPFHMSSPSEFQSKCGREFHLPFKC